MKDRLCGASLALLVALLGTTALADQLTLKNGREYSGKFVRGDANNVEFRTGGKVQSFKTTEIAKIIFGEPALAPAVTKQDTRSGSGEAQPNPRQTPVQSRTVPSVTYPEGTTITIRTEEWVDTDRNRVGDLFSATLEDPLIMGSQVVVARGAAVKGRITESKESGRISGKSELALELTEIRAKGRTYALQTGEYSEVGSSRGTQTAKAVGGGAAVGTLIGAIAGGKKGAAIGAAAGAATGTGVQLLTKGQTLKIPPETVLEFKLKAPLSVAVP